MSRTWRRIHRSNCNRTRARGTRNARWRGNPTRRGRRRAPKLRVACDASAVFRAAIAAGLLSAERSNPRWAGHYFYMFHDGDGAAWFKHRDTRAHVVMSARRQASVGYRFGERGT